MPQNNIKLMVNALQTTIKIREAKPQDRHV